MLQLFGDLVLQTPYRGFVPGLADFHPPLSLLSTPINNVSNPAPLLSCEDTHHETCWLVKSR